MPIKFSVFIDKIHGQSDTAGMQTNAPNAAGAPVLLPSAHSPLCWYDGHGCHDKGCLETGGGGVCQVSKYLKIVAKIFHFHTTGKTPPTWKTQVFPGGLSSSDLNLITIQQRSGQFRVGSGSVHSVFGSAKMP